ncbi:MAG TPA: glycerophosphodiester phosphodiesterase, partial [Bacteroidetes bacterium]|nr:glycerophosphodiester phosphodiesterase [Bacteroidota bacterium]
MDIQGHRGCRGQMPENTIIGFLSALDRGVNTLELDVVITGDHQVLVSHEAWFSHKYCLDPQGNEIPQSEERKHNIFQMPYAKTREYDCGSKYDAEFPDQEKSVQHKPLLSDVIRAVDAHLSTTERNLPKFNIELKREPNAKGLFQPALPEFVRLVMLALKTNQAAKRTTLQAFGIDTLQEIHATAPAMRTSLLIGSSE